MNRRRPIIPMTHSIQDEPMATADTSTNLAEDKEKLRDEWLARLSDLVETVRGWAEELDWSTRRIETKMEDSEIGNYKAPALIIQKETVRAILQPIGRSAPGVAGVVDFYIMPAYDDIAQALSSTMMRGICIICPPDRRTSGPIAGTSRSPGRRSRPSSKR